jgi:hypothetical protein
MQKEKPYVKRSEITIFCSLKEFEEKKNNGQLGVYFQEKLAEIQQIREDKKDNPPEEPDTPDEIPDFPDVPDENPNEDDDPEKDKEKDDPNEREKQELQRKIKRLERKSNRTPEEEQG